MGRRPRNEAHETALTEQDRQLDQDWREMERLWDEHGPAIERYNLLLRRWERGARDRLARERLWDRKEGP